MFEPSKTCVYFNYDFLFIFSVFWTGLSKQSAIQNQYLAKNNKGPKFISLRRSLIIWVLSSIMHSADSLMQNTEELHRKYFMYSLSFISTLLRWIRRWYCPLCENYILVHDDARINCFLYKTYLETGYRKWNYCEVKVIVIYDDWCISIGFWGVGVSLKLFP